MKLSLSRLRANDAPWIDHDIEQSLTELATSLGDRDAPVELIIVDDPYIQRVNREYRGKDRPTDVISFSYVTDDAPSGAGADERAIGEVYVSYETLEREAKARRVEPGSLFLRVGVHGLLHVIGFDHDNDADADRMEQEERRILGACFSRTILDSLI